MAGRITVIAALGTTQTIAWASSYYMPAILAAPIAEALHLSSSVFFGLFSGALLLSAVIGPSVGHLIDHHGGRAVLTASNLVIAAGLIILAAANGVAALVIAWTVLGIGIGMGLYDPAFAALTWLYGREARSAITGITLIAGFASTIGWPLSAIFLNEWGWRPACLIWAGLNMLLAAPLNWLILPQHGAPPALPPKATELPATRPPARRCRSWRSFLPRRGSCRERWQHICRGCFGRRARPRQPQLPPRRWSARPRSAPGLSSSACYARSTRYRRRG